MTLCPYLCLLTKKYTFDMPYFYFIDFLSPSFSILPWIQSKTYFDFSFFSIFSILRFLQISFPSLSSLFFSIFKIHHLSVDDISSDDESVANPNDDKNGDKRVREQEQGKVFYLI